MQVRGVDMRAKKMLCSSKSEYELRGGLVMIKKDTSSCAANLEREWSLRKAK
jgi:hypothetical protein